MHDPQTVAFTIPMFWTRRNSWGYRPPLVTIWHVDPERGGSDDSCDWFGRKISKQESELAESLVDNEIDNVRTFFSRYISAPPCPTHQYREDCDFDGDCPRGEFVETCDRDEMKNRIKLLFASHNRHTRFRYPVRWHFWHWKLQIHPIQSFKRWAFSRCQKCGNGFKWGETPIGYSWHGTGPLWFRSEKQIAHRSCDGSTGFTPATPRADTATELDGARKE